MTILVYEAIQKYINPTRYRQIVETASCDLLTPSEQEIVSHDQKHNSNVARVYYRKKNLAKLRKRVKFVWQKWLETVGKIQMPLLIMFLPI